MLSVYENNVIKIQRIFRINKLKSFMYDILIKYDLNNINQYTFYDFSKIIRSKKLLESITILIKNFNNVLECKMNNKVLLTSFLITHFNEELLGKEKEYTPFDKQIYMWSKKLTELFTELTQEKDYFIFKKFINYLNNYNLVFDEWKKFDKDRTIQNLIISFYHRKEHISHIDKNEDTSVEDKKLLIQFLDKECSNILKDILMIDNNFDIDYLQNNYTTLYQQIKFGMENMIENITTNYKKAYLNLITEEFKKDNNQVIFNLIKETNDRLLDITPDKYKNSIRDKFDSYDYLNILLEKGWTNKLYEYLDFLIDTTIIYSPPSEDEMNIEWKNEITTLFNLDYHANFPCILLEINMKIDYIYQKIAELI